MHIKRNISDNIVKHMFGEKDTPTMRRDLEEVVHQSATNPRRALWLIETASHLIKPKAPYVFNDSERASFLNLVSHKKLPSEYSSTLIKHLGEKKLSGLKSHDHHVLLQQILPAAIRHSLKKGPGDAIIKVGNCFKRICAKAVRTADIPALRSYVVETVCLLEI